MNFPNIKREKKPIRMPIVKKNYRLERLVNRKENESRIKKVNNKNLQR